MQGNHTENEAQAQHQYNDRVDFEARRFIRIELYSGERVQISLLSMWQRSSFPSLPSCAYAPIHIHNAKNPPAKHKNGT
jgi:hypothetical protein